MAGNPTMATRGRSIINDCSDTLDDWTSTGLLGWQWMSRKDGLSKRSLRKEGDGSDVSALLSNITEFQADDGENMSATFPSRRAYRATRQYKKNMVGDLDQPTSSGLYGRKMTQALWMNASRPR